MITNYFNNISFCRYQTKMEFHEIEGSSLEVRAMDPGLGHSSKCLISRDVFEA